MNSTKTDTWYNLAYQNETLHVDIFGDIGDWGVSAEGFIGELRSAKGKDLVLNISSLGGSVNDALQIHDYLASYEGKVTAKITGLTASSATIIAMGAKEVLMSENSLFLIHNVWTPMTAGNADDLENEAESLRQIDELLINIYKKKTKRAASTIKKLMAEERWMDAEEALRLGFIDKTYIPSKDIINKVILNKIDEDNLPALPENVIGNFINSHNQNQDKMTLDKINEKIDVVINKIENLFIKEDEAVETLNKAEVEATLNAEIKELSDLYTWQLNEQSETINSKNTEIENLKLNFEESLKELNEKIEKLSANETVVVKEEDAPLVEKAEEVNPFDGLAEKLKW
jgi:ATP-dependent protease ClpP protease subunit